MKTKYVITHDYGNSVPTTVSKHRTIESAERKFNKMRRAFNKIYPSQFPITYIFPYSLRAL